MNRNSNPAARLAGAAALLVAALAASPGLAQALKPQRHAGIEVPAPLPPGQVTETHWGTTVADPWRHLENVKDPAVQDWMRAQADATTKIFARIPGRDAMLARMREIEGSAAGLTQQVVRADNGRLFFLRRNPGEDQFKLVWRDGPGGADHVIVDPEALSKAAGRTHAVMDWRPSRDGTRLAYSMQVGGGEIGVLHVVDVASGRALTAPIDRIRYASVSWLDDGSGFFYSRLKEGFEQQPPQQRFHDRRTHFHALDGKGSDRLVASPTHNADLGWPIFASAWVAQIPGTQQAMAWVFRGVERNTMLYTAPLADAMAGTAKWRRVFDHTDEVSALSWQGGHFFAKSAKGAPRYRILRIPVDADIGRAEVLVAEERGVVDSLGMARDGLYFTRLEGATQSLYRIAADARPGTPAQRIALPVQGAVDIKSASPRQDGVVIALGGWTRASKDYTLGADGRATRLALAPDGTYDAPDSIEAREVMLRSHDGVEVPLSIVMKKGLKPDGSNPAIVYGYGAYGVVDEPYFNPRLLAYLERGGIFAVAHVRGGGAFGKGWHEAGRKVTKPNTWKDGIAAAEWLIAQGWTSKARVGIYGGSAGGIFVGRAITERPDLFAAAVPLVGTMDGMRFETSANGAANIPEFGTVKDEAEFRALLAMSSYHHVRDGVRYPGVLLGHGVNDIRVDVWQSAKFASRLAQAQSSGEGPVRPVLMRLEYDAGHGSGTTRAQAQERSADVYSFFLWQFGVPEFQPRAAGL